jgi:hypothetical protein
MSCEIAAVYRPEGIAVVTVAGSCGDEDSARLRTLFDELLGDDDLPAIVLDLLRVETLGPNGLYAVLEGQRAADDAGVPVVAVLDLGAAVLSEHEPQLASLRNSITTYPTLEKALDGLSGEG